MHSSLAATRTDSNGPPTISPRAAHPRRPRRAAHPRRLRCAPSPAHSYPDNSTNTPPLVDYVCPFRYPLPCALLALLSPLTPPQRKDRPAPRPRPRAAARARRRVRGQGQGHPAPAPAAVARRVDAHARGRARRAYRSTLNPTQPTPANAEHTRSCASRPRTSGRSASRCVSHPSHTTVAADPRAALQAPRGVLRHPHARPLHPRDPRAPRPARRHRPPRWRRCRRGPGHQPAHARREPERRDGGHRRPQVQRCVCASRASTNSH